MVKAAEAGEPAWCYQENGPKTGGNRYAKLYNWYAVNDPRGLAPEGWRIPTNADWSTW
ncbi:MAG: fibrobacter succinogenes major paralogous domain-containing protein [Marinilabiliales bacterium]|nr:fibrobacter succinogenes major paralogous domain-containing protein [Marinilabiliales bacterium]